MKRLDLTGKRFGRITITRSIGSNTLGRSVWEYRCDCGNVKRNLGSALNAGRFLSCGCLRNETTAKLNRKAPGVSSRNRLIENYRRRAKVKGYEFELSEDAFFALVALDCHYCGSAPNSDTRIINSHGANDSSFHFKYNGIDRIDSSFGYIETNVVPCCRTCNLAKRELPQVDFVGWLKRLLLRGGGKALAASCDI